MAEKTKDLKRPKGISRLLFRLPIWLYRGRMGWLMGERMLLLNHTGRVTGLPRQTVLEVADRDREKGAYIVVAAFGPKTDWYQNLLANPRTTIQVGRRTLSVQAERLPSDTAGEVMLRFAKDHPFEARFAGLIGYQLDGSDADYRALGEALIMVRLMPV